MVLGELPATISPESRTHLEAIGKQFELDDGRLLAITNQFVEDFSLGLGQYNKAMAMIPTFVTGVPDGTEKGTFLALDLGGTNLRVCEVQLDGNKGFSLRQRKYKLSEELKTGEATVLFDYLAGSVASFLAETKPPVTEVEKLHLGLTFSFPVEQTALNKGMLLTWTKGFAAKNAIGHDVVGLLQSAFDRQNVCVNCVALVNDTVGALLSRAYTSGGCLLGAIFGTGTNGAYVEDVANIAKLKNSDAAALGGKMIVNTEWGGFNNSRSILPSTPYDNKLDRESINPRFQAYEKFISGMYLGEITRNTLLSLVDAVPPILFNGSSTPSLNTHYGFDTAVMTDIETAQSVDEVKGVLVAQLGFTKEQVSNEDALIVRWVCELVATRAAKLSGCAIAAVLIQSRLAQLGGGIYATSTNGLAPESNQEKLRVGVDGSLIQHYPNFESRLRGALRAIVGQTVEARVEIGLAKDGSGVGAALCALQASKQERELRAQQLEAIFEKP